MTLLKALTLLFAAFTATARAEQPAQARSLPEPRHLFPVNPYRPLRHEKYVKLCNELLRVAEAESIELFQTYKWGTAIMVRRPSFEAEECVALMEEDGGREYRLVYTRADRNIWSSIPQDVEKKNNEENKDGRRGEGTKGDRVRIKVVRMTKPLDRNRAIRVYKLWARMLRGVRYPDASFAGWLDDGETFEFRWMGMYGETRTPSVGAPKTLVDVGRALILCCKSQNDELAKSLSLLDKKCEELEKFFDTKGGKAQ